MKKSIFPFWMIAAACLIAIYILWSGLEVYFYPNMAFHGMSFDDQKVLALAQRLAAFQIAFGISIGVALYTQSVSMLKVLMTCFCIFTLQETIIGFSYVDMTLMVYSFVLCVMSAFIVFIANGLKRKRKRLHFLKTDQQATRSSNSTDDED